MSDEKVLTKRVAEQFLTDQTSIHLSEFTAIEDDAAEVLEAFGGRDLRLAGLTNLTENTAKSLSRFSGRLWLDGLASISDSAAHRLREHEGDLSLNGLTDTSEALMTLTAPEAPLNSKEHGLSLQGLLSISDELAARFSERYPLPELRLKSFPARPGHIALATAMVNQSCERLDETSRIELLEPEIAEEFAKAEKHLTFTQVRAVGLDVASALIQHKKGSLWFASVESVAAPVAELLSRHGPKLFLSNLRVIENTKSHKKLLKKLIKSQVYAEFQFEELPLWLLEEILQQLTKANYRDHIAFPKLATIENDVLKRLCECKCGFRGQLDLRLDGLRELPESAAEAIALHCGALSMKGLVGITDAVAVSLGQHEGQFDISGIKTLSSFAAQHIAQSRYNLDLNGLETIEEKVAEQLARHTGKMLGLAGLSTITLPAAQHLAQYVGELRLGISEFDATQAEALACHSIELAIDCVTEIDSETAKHLARHRRLISMLSLSRIAEDAARELAQHPGPIRVNLEKLPQASADVLRHAFPKHSGVQLYR